MVKLLTVSASKVSYLFEKNIEVNVSDNFALPKNEEEIFGR